jgi:hypothetical protein
MFSLLNKLLALCAWDIELEAPYLGSCFPNQPASVTRSFAGVLEYWWPVLL